MRDVNCLMQSACTGESGKDILWHNDGKWFWHTIEFCCFCATFCGRIRLMFTPIVSLTELIAYFSGRLLLFYAMEGENEQTRSTLLHYINLFQAFTGGWGLYQQVLFHCLGLLSAMKNIITFGVTGEYLVDVPLQVFVVHSELDGPLEEILERPLTCS